MGRRRNELRNAASLILKLRIIVVAVRSEDQFLYANFSPPPLLASAPSLHLLWRRHCTRLETKAKDTKKIRGQGQPFRGQTLSRPRTRMLEAKDQEQRRKCSQKKNFFLGNLKKRS